MRYRNENRLVRSQLVSSLGLGLNASLFYLFVLEERLLIFGVDLAQRWD
jgi:hypothetical protein